MAQIDEINDERPRENGRTNAFYAIQSDHTGEALIACLNDGTDMDAIDDRGDTALHWACWHRREQSFRILVERGAQLNIQNYKGHAPLHHVIARFPPLKTFQAVAYLIDKGADPSLPDKQGKTAYHAILSENLALSFEQVSALAQLLTQHAVEGWFVPDGEGRTALDYARSSPDGAVAGMLSALQGAILQDATSVASARSLPRRI